MDFTHTEERQMLADTLARWILNDYPLAARLEAGAGALGFDERKYASLVELGLPMALFAEADGGFGGQGFDLMVVFEALGRGLVVEPVLQSAVLAGGALAACGRDDLVGAIQSGEARAALAHFEPDDGGNSAPIACAATRAGDAWELTGTKSVVRHATSADHLVISAMLDGKQALFLTTPQAVGLLDYQTIDGGRAADVTLAGASADLLAADAGAILETVLGRGMLCLCSEALGIMDTIKDMTIEYVRTRKQFGVPIGKFQALQHRLAEMLLEIEQARSAVIRAAAGLETPGVPRERSLSAAMVTIGRAGTLVAEESVQIHGGMGMTWEYPLGHYVKRLTMITQEMGDEDYHLMRYVRLGKAQV